MWTRNTIRMTILAGAALFALPAFAFQQAPATNAVGNAARTTSSNSARVLARALETAEAVKDGEERVGVLSSVMEAQASTGDLAAALKTLDRIPEVIQSGEITTHVKPGAVIALARIQVKAGDYPAAMRSVAHLAKSTDSGAMRLELVYEIAVGQIGKGRPAEALETIGTVPTPTAEALNELTTQSSIPGWGFLHADRTASLIVDVLGRAAGAYAKAGDAAHAAEALEKAERIAGIPKDQRLQNVLRADIITGRAHGGDVAGALQAAGALRDKASRSSALAGIAAIQAENGDIAGARTTAEGIKESRSLGETLMAIGAAQLKAKDRDGAAKSFRESVKHLSAFRTMDDDFHFLMGVVAGQYMAGDLEGAVQSSKMFNPSEPQVAQNLQSMAGMSAISGLIEDGDLAAADKLYTSIRARMGGPGADVLAELALAHARAGDAPGALKAITEVRSQLAAIGNKEASAMILPTLAEALAETGDFAGAVATLKEIDSSPASMGEYLRTQAYQAVARVQGRRGDETGALKWIDPLEPPSLKARTLIGLAEGLARRAAG